MRIHPLPFSSLERPPARLGSWPPPHVTVTPAFVMTFPSLTLVPQLPLITTLVHEGRLLCAQLQGSTHSFLIPRGRLPDGWASAPSLALTRPGRGGPATGHMVLGLCEELSQVR